MFNLIFTCVVILIYLIVAFFSFLVITFCSSNAKRNVSLSVLLFWQSEKLPEQSGR